MSKLLTLPLAVWLLGCIMTPAAAQAPAIDVKTGLWEVSSTQSSAGMPEMPAVPQLPPEVLAAMPPSQRERIEAAMKAARGQSGGTRVTKFCLTREALQRGPDFGAETRPSCKRTIRTRSRTAWEMQETCTERGGRQTIHVRYQAPSPDTMQGTVEIAMNDGGRQMTMRQDMRGRWLGANCGDVKPK